MVQSEFQENTKMLMVPTNNIFDQKYCVTLGTVSQKYFPIKKLVPRLYIVHGSK